MVELQQLRYVRLITDDLGSAADFSQRVMGLEPIDRNAEIATFRSDFRDYTLAFATGERARPVDRPGGALSAGSRRRARGIARARTFRRARVGRGLRAAQGQGHGLVHRLQRQPHRTGGAAAQFGLALLSEPRCRRQGPRRRDHAQHRHREGPVDLDRRARRARQRLGGRSRLSALRRRASPDRAVPGRKAWNSRRRIRGRGRQPADAEFLRAARPADRRRAWAGTPPRVRAAVPDLRRPRRRAVQLRRGRRRGRCGSAPAAPVSRRPGRTVQLGQRMQDRRVQRRRARPQRPDHVRCERRLPP